MRRPDDGTERPPQRADQPTRWRLRWLRGLLAQCGVIDATAQQVFVGDERACSDADERRRPMP
ncbi:MAG TPA: hypothetical protein VFG42_24010 [Baekduia sp.]|uniref:hypothetical protein n=1 Tax=Baekduia sp. TaxID=2600305 RepID=UPI002D786066|nr:hypothetical protein [Baekduia sp.]HET6509879.1 hypothetical protein [Baekduia sp.]